MNKIRFFALGVGLLAGLAHPAPTRAQAAAPVAEWNFEEGTGTNAADSSGHGSTAVLPTDAGWVAGRVGAHALRLTGADGSFVDVPRPVIDTALSYTATAWVRVKGATGYQTFVSEDGDQVSNFYLQLRGDTGGFAFTAMPSDLVQDAAIARAKGPAKADVWYHIAGVHDAAAHTVTLYVDGVAQQTVPFTTPWHAPGHTLIGRGRFTGSPVDFVNGQIDDVRLYQSALTGADIAALAQAVPGPTAPPGLAALKIDAARPGPRVSPLFYGLMTEEINYSYDGGLYGELIQNRVFKNDPKTPAHWSVVQGGGGAGSLALDDTQPLNAALTTSLKVSVTAASGGQRVGVANDGYWGIPVRPGTAYRASFYARAAPGFAGPLTVGIESADGATVYARAVVPGITGAWKRYAVTLKTGRVTPTAATRFVVTAARPGTLWLNLVSLFPPTFHDRPNGNRPDLMRRLADLHPAFLRLPGGNYLEGDTVATRFDWKKTVGPVASRPGHQGPWNYRSDDGLGLLEFLEWCEDLHMQPLLAVYAGYSLKQERVTPGPDLQPYVQDALDEIEYATGAADTPWGARRAADGHPAPFQIDYVEVGNEDQFDRAHTYDGRFTQFYDAIRAKYPKLQLIATAAVTSRTPDVIDEHFYRQAQAMEEDAGHYDGYDRKGPKIFVGEWASQDVDRPWQQPETKGPTPTLNSALGDAAWMTGMERNSDVVIMEAYAPLLVNVNPGGRQWAVNLIGYDALTSYGSPSYYVQAMFAAHHGDTILPSVLTGGTRLSQSVTQDSRTGTVTLKVVNSSPTAQPVHLTLTGVPAVLPTGTAVVLSGTGPSDTNTLADPTHIVPVTKAVAGLGSDFTYTFAPYSVTILEMRTR